MSTENTDWGGRGISAGVGFVLGALAVAVPTFRQIAQQKEQLRSNSHLAAAAQVRAYEAEQKLQALAAGSPTNPSRAENGAAPSE